MGRKEYSAYGLCHLGDYEATLFSEHSQNRCCGEAVVSGKSYDKLAEGVHMVKALRNPGKNYGVELPVCEAVYQILYHSKQPRLILEQLFSRVSKANLNTLKHSEKKIMVAFIFYAHYNVLWKEKTTKQKMVFQQP